MYLLETVYLGLTTFHDCRLVFYISISLDTNTNLSKERIVYINQKVVVGVLILKGKLCILKCVFLEDDLVLQLLLSLPQYSRD